jgi:hypothetical protein
MVDGLQGRGKRAAADTARFACLDIAGKEPWAALLTTHDGGWSCCTAFERGKWMTTAETGTRFVADGRQAVGRIKSRYTERRKGSQVTVSMSRIHKVQS